MDDARFLDDLAARQRAAWPAGLATVPVRPHVAFRGSLALGAAYVLVDPLFREDERVHGRRRRAGGPELRRRNHRPAQGLHAHAARHGPLRGGLVAEGAWGMNETHTSDTFTTGKVRKVEPQAALAAETD